MVNKDIFAAILCRDKSVTLLIVEPLYSTLRHTLQILPYLLVWTLLNTRNINVKSWWRQEIKQERLVSAVLYIVAQNGVTQVPMRFQNALSCDLPGWNMPETINSTWHT